MTNKVKSSLASKSLTATASAVVSVLALGALSPAHAQDNVSIYGRVVAGIDYQSNVALAGGGSGSLLRAAGNQWGTSMIGFKGAEQLGGGLQALFLLESGFDATKGVTNGAALFNRRAYVGLADAGWGNLKLGKNLAIANDVWFLDPTGQQFIGSATLVRGRSWQGANNIIEYQTPNFGGFTAAVQTGLGEQAGSSSALRKDGISLAYTTPMVEVRAIYDVARDAAGGYSDLYNTSKEFTLGGTVTLDKLKLFAAYQDLSAPDVAAGTPDKAKHYWIGANYQASPALTLIGAAYHTSVNQGGGRGNLYMVGANYNFSKRTLAYASFGTVRNSNGANFSVEATNNNPLPGQNQNGAYVGVSHSF